MINPTTPLCRLLIAWTITWNSVASQSTLVSVTESLAKSQIDAVIAKDASSFVELITKSNIFVDKSLLIKEVLENSGQTILITHPRKWGKSVNLDMIRTFVQLEVDLNGNETSAIEQTLSYKLFVKNQLPPCEEDDDEGWRNLRHPLLITQHQHLLDKYRGKFPVIYLNLAHPKSKLYHSYVAATKEAIFQTFSSHKYLTESFCRRINEHSSNKTHVGILEEEMRFFHDIIYGEAIGENQLAKSIKLLSKMVHDHFNKRVFVLIDHYDILIDQVFFIRHNSSKEENKHTAFTFFKQLIWETFKNNDFIEKGIAAGLLGIDEYFSSIGDLTEYNTLNKNTVTFFGFIKRELEKLFHYFIIPPPFADKIYAEQSGYKIATDVDPFFNPQSIVWFLNNQTSLGLLPNFRTKIGDVVFHSTYEIPQKKISDIFGWLNNVTIQFDHLRFNEHELENIQTIIFSSEDKRDLLVNPENVKLILLYLYATGFITFSEDVTKRVTDKTAEILIRLA